MTFEAFAKIPRFNRPIVITEKIDGTNAQIFIEHEALVYADGSELPGFELAKIDDHIMFAGSRSRFLQPGKQDNYGFAAWAQTNAKELFKLGPGRHFGEWWGSGIQRGYGLPRGEKRFSLFNVSRWATDPNVGDPSHAPAPECCHVQA